MDKTIAKNQGVDAMNIINDFDAELVINSPGRINLIGEHTDYNNGFVMPTAVEKSIKFYLKRNDTPSSCFINSLSFNTSFEHDIKNPILDGPEWTRYIVGVIEEIKKLGHTVQGFDCLMTSNLPMGAGISSSAALECGLATGLNELFDLGLSKLEIVKLSQRAEHNYVGTLCGIMDQYASVMSKDGYILKLDCRSIEHEFIPFDIAPYTLLLLNTNVEHSLASSEYNPRRDECARGVAVLRKKFPEIESLRDATLEHIEACKDDMSITLYNRCTYIVEENLRVEEAGNALKKGDLEKFGQLMYESHEGLQHKYKVSCPELDFLTDFSKNHQDILGCRMMGGGFGGCTINLIHQDAMEDYIARATKAYKEKFNIDLTAFTTTPANGTTIL